MTTLSVSRSCADTVRLRNDHTVSQQILCSPAETGTATVSATPAAVSDTDVRYCGAEVKFGVIAE